jgi:uncharacterized membrane protein YsdA (DUF1294 family)/cold shock CspA family protein
VKGRISHWNDEKGYGFIAPIDGGKELFFHVSSLADRHRRPREHEPVSYRASTGRNGKPCAVDIDYLRSPAGTALPRSPVVLLALSFLVVVLVAVLAKALPPVVLVLYIAMSLLTYWMYAADKTAAKRDAWRVSEKILHILSLAGGWPGAILAQTRLRHKTVKQPFKTIFWTTVILNVGIFMLFLTPNGETILREFFESLI